MSGLRKYIPINSVAASAADLAVASDGNVVITGDSGFHRPDVDSISVLRYRPSVAEKRRITATASAAANTTYSFYIEQDLRDTNDVTIPTRVLISLTTNATTAASATAFGNALTAVVNGKITDNGLSLTAAAYTSGNGGVDLTGSATNSTFKVSQLKNLSEAKLLQNGASSGNASYSGTLITVLHATSTDLVAGGQVKITGWGGVAVINGVTASSSVTLPVKSVSAGTNFVLIADSISGSIGTATLTFEVIAQDERGAGAYYIAKNITSGGSPTAVSVSSSGKYHEVIVSGAAPSGQSQLTKDKAPFETHFLIESTDTDANDLLDRIVEVKNYQDASGNFDPLLLL